MCSTVSDLLRWSSVCNFSSRLSANRTHGHEVLSDVPGYIGGLPSSGVARLPVALVELLVRWLNQYLESQSHSDLDGH